MRQASRIGGGLGFVDADEHPAGRPINRHKQVAAGRFVSHLRQILDVHVQIAGLIGLERLVLRSGAFRLQIAQIANPMPPQTPVKPRARDLRVEKLPQRAIEGALVQAQWRAPAGRRSTPTASCAEPPHSLLRRGQRGLKPLRRVTAVMNALTMPPFVNGLLSRPVSLCQNRRSLVTALDRSPHLRRRRRLLVKMDQHGRTPLRMSLRIDLAMKNAERRGSM